MLFRSEKWGRKPVIALFLAGTAIFAMVFGFSDSLTMIMISGMLLSFFNLGAWGAMYAYSPELYPTSIRATANGAAQGFGRLGGILGPLSIGFFLSLHFTFAHIFSVFSVALIIAIVVILTMGKETRGTSID